MTPLADHLQIISTLDMPRPDWLALRANRIGGSDCGAILGLNPYMSSLELFHMFVGDAGSMYSKGSNMAMLMGNKLEPIALDLYRYWGGHPDALVHNLELGQQEQTATAGSCLVVNPKYPHLHASPDGFIHQAHDGRTDGILEIKTIAGLAADKYEGGLPPSYLIQLQQYLLVCEKSWGEFAVLKDGRSFEVLRVEANAGIQQTILATTTEFWRRVSQARDVWADVLIPDQDKQHHIARLEPEPDESPAYESYLKARWRTDYQLRPGSDEEYELALEVEQLQGVTKEMASHLQGSKNRLLKLLDGCDGVEWPNRGKVTNRADSRGVRSLRLSLKKE